MTHYTNLLSFDVPEQIGIEDKTVHLLEIKRGAHTPLSLTIENSALRPGEHLEDVTRGVIESRRVAVPGFTVIADECLDADGAPVYSLKLRFRGRKGLEYERQAHFLAGSRHVLLALSCAMDDRDYADQWFEHTLRTLQVRA